MNHQRDQGEDGVLVSANSPRKYLGVMNPTSQAFEAGHVLQPPLTNTVNLQAALVPGQDDILRTSYTVGARELIETKVESLVARLHTGLWLDSEV
jgi:hypothetical protein